VQVSAANTAKGDLNFDLLASALRLFDIENADVAISGGMFNECFHPGLRIAHGSFLHVSSLMNVTMNSKWLTHHSFLR